MPGKRKRSRPHRTHDTSTLHRPVHEPIVKQALLRLYYPQVLTLREYLLSRLPSASKVRRRKILSLARHDHAGLASALDQTLIGVSGAATKGATHTDRQQLWTSFSQRRSQDESRMSERSSVGSVVSQSEIIHCCIYSIFQRDPKTATKHLLCQGYRRNVTRSMEFRGDPGTSAIPGVVSICPNRNVSIITSDPWPQILSLLGQEGERIMFDLVLDCAIYRAIDGDQGNYHQLSGMPLGDLEITSGAAGGASSPITPGNISFVRNRMLYARASLNARGGVRFGFRHIHAFNRYPYKPSDPCEEQQKTTVILKYIFPRQFGLHNVFTSKVDRQETVHPFKDYTLREDEINGIDQRRQIPKRLRGLPMELTGKMRKLHDRCPYYELLKHYCPDPTSQETPDHARTSVTTAPKLPGNAPTESSLLDRATSVEAVSAFCRAVFQRLIPNDFWGQAEIQEYNKGRFLYNVDRFVKLRRFENLSLHEVVQEMKITQIEWLCPPALANHKTSQTDISKRREIFHEFLYYLFDSLLIPLIRSHFHVTESGVHRYRLFFFRHDVWKDFSEPAMASLKASMFEELHRDRAHAILASRSLGFSQVRLLPKATGIRPIMNLRRRTLVKGNKTKLGYSINTTLAPVYNMLTYEKNTYPEHLGSALFSVSDIHPRLQAYKLQHPHPTTEFFFAKVDVQAAFDTIPQAAVLQLMRTLPHSALYRIAKHLEIKPGERDPAHPEKTKPIRKWRSLAQPPDAARPFVDTLGGLATGKKNTVFVETITPTTKKTTDLLALLEDHITRNLVKIGKKYYRQKRGIPQGSVVSSLLCNYFYADFERTHLPFLASESGGESLLLRLIDDFLLITTKRAHAERFLDVMLAGAPAYGIRVKASKTLTNFAYSVGGHAMHRIGDGEHAPVAGDGGDEDSPTFPYCNTLISTRSLAVSKAPFSFAATPADATRATPSKGLADSLTIEYARAPGRTFRRKVLNAFKIGAAAMFLDARLNGPEGVARNLRRAALETAAKMVAYARALRRGGRRREAGVSASLLRECVAGVVALAHVLIRRRTRGLVGGGGGGGAMGCAGALSRRRVACVVLRAFAAVLCRKQSAHGEALAWVRGELAALGGGGGRKKRKR